MPSAADRRCAPGRRGPPGSGKSPGLRRRPATGASVASTTTSGPESPPADRHARARCGTSERCAEVEVPHRHAGLLQGGLEGEAAADQEGHQVVTPVRRGVQVSRCSPVVVDPVGGEVGAEVAAEERGRGGPGLGHVEDRAGPWVALGEEQEVEGAVPGSGQEVRLGRARRPAGGVRLPAPRGTFCRASRGVVGACRAAGDRLPRRRRHRRPPVGSTGTAAPAPAAPGRPGPRPHRRPRLPPGSRR